MRGAKAKLALLGSLWFSPSGDAVFELGSMQIVDLRFVNFGHLLHSRVPRITAMFMLR
jgi:hypothetical protein